MRTIEDADDRRATWLELFFDLVFVVAVGQLGTLLFEQPTLEGLGRFVALFVPVWWCWMGFTFYANRFDTDDLPYRLLTLLAMFGVAALSTTIHDVFHGGSAGFVWAYVGVRAVLIALYARARRHVAEGRGLATFYLAVFSAGAGAWLASLLLPTPWRYAVWAAALGVELVAPLFGWSLLPRAPISPRHIPERFGLLTLIVLGESVLAVVVGVTGVSWDASSALAAAAGFVAAASLWWVYFDFVDADTAGRGYLGGFVYFYSHFAIVVGLAALGVGVRLAVVSAAGPRYDGTAWVLCVGILLVMLGLAAIQLVTPPTRLDTDVWPRLGAAAVAVVLLPLGLSPVHVVSAIALSLAAQVAFEIWGHQLHTAG